MTNKQEIICTDVYWNNISLAESYQCD